MEPVDLGHHPVGAKFADQCQVQIVLITMALLGVYVFTHVDDVVHLPTQLVLSHP